MSTSFAIEATDDNVLTDGKTAQSRTQIRVAPPPNLWILPQEPETLCDGVNQTIGDFDAAALTHDIEPDVVKFAFGLRRETKPH